VQFIDSDETGLPRKIWKILNNPTSYLDSSPKTLKILSGNVFEGFLTRFYECMLMAFGVVLLHSEMD
jgi:hypothetical protein